MSSTIRFWPSYTHTKPSLLQGHKQRLQCIAQVKRYVSSFWRAVMLAYATAPPGAPSLGRGAGQQAHQLSSAAVSGQPRPVDEFALDAEVDDCLHSPTGFSSGAGVVLWRPLLRWLQPLLAQQDVPEAARGTIKAWIKSTDPAVACQGYTVRRLAGWLLASYLTPWS
jgi:hypothetical protein